MKNLMMLVLAISACLWIPQSLIAQNAPMSFEKITYSIDSGTLTHRDLEPQVLFSTVVAQPGAEWLRLEFGDVMLDGITVRPPGDSSEEEDGAEEKGAEKALSFTGSEAQTGAFEPKIPSYLRLTSMLDGNSQHMEIRHLQSWRNTSAYFNGDEVLVELVAGPGGREHRVRVENIQVGVWTDAQRQICFDDDERVPTADPRVASILGCTAFLIDDGINNMLMTAGHCHEHLGEGDVVHFNVSSRGVAAAPQDQYLVDPSSVQLQDGNDSCNILECDFGQDWAYFGVLPQYGDDLGRDRLPFEAQGAAFEIAQAEIDTIITLTGFGVDSEGPIVCASCLQTRPGSATGFHDNGDSLFHTADAADGDSGGPIINGAGQVVAVHTDGYCNNPLVEANVGTTFNNPHLLGALARPRGMAAPQEPPLLEFAAPFPTISDQYTVTLRTDPPIRHRPVWRFGIGGPQGLYNDMVGTTDANGVLTFTDQRDCGFYFEGFAVTFYGAMAGDHYVAKSCYEVARPAAGEVWRCGETRRIEWTIPRLPTTDLELWSGGGKVRDIATVGNSLRTFDWQIPTDLSSGTYEIRAGDEIFDINSILSESFTIDCNCGAPPLFDGIRTVSESSGSGCALEVAWDPATPHCGADVAYNVYRASHPNVQATAAHLVAQSVQGTTFIDHDVMDAGQYYYLVRAVDPATGLDDGNNLINSGSPDCTAGTCAPNFGGLATVEQEPSQECAVELGWSYATPRCGDPITYNVYRAPHLGLHANGSYLIAEGLIQNSYSDLDVTDGGTYYYLVQAVSSQTGEFDGNAVKPFWTVNCGGPHHTFLASAGTSATQPVSPGTQVTLSWNIPGAESVLLVGIDSFEGSSGTAVVTPQSTSIYTLFADGSEYLETVHVTAGSSANKFDPCDRPCSEALTIGGVLHYCRGVENAQTPSLDRDPVWISTDDWQTLVGPSSPPISPYCFEGRCGDGTLALQRWHPPGSLPESWVEERSELEEILGDGLDNNCDGVIQ